MFQTTFVEKIKTRFLFNNFFSENRAVYKIMWNNMVGRQATDDNINTALKRRNLHAGN
jgi:hypothetical protein